MSKWSDIKIYDLSIPIGISTPPWPTYEPLQVKYFKRLAPNGANGQLVTHSNHVGTHLDGPRHFDTAGRDIAALELTKLCAPGVVVDLSDMAEDFGIYTPEDIEKRVEVREGDILIINTGYHKYGFDQPEADERRYMLRHPGPSLDFIKWVREKKIKWLGVDCGSADHPMNTKIRDWEPMEAEKCDAIFRKKYGKSLNEIYPWPEHYQAMHLANDAEQGAPRQHASQPDGADVGAHSRRNGCSYFKKSKKSGDACASFGNWKGNLPTGLRDYHADGFRACNG